MKERRGRSIWERCLKGRFNRAQGCEGREKRVAWGTISPSDRDWLRGGGKKKEPNQQQSSERVVPEGSRRSQGACTKIKWTAVGIQIHGRGNGRWSHRRGLAYLQEGEENKSLGGRDGFIDFGKEENLLQRGFWSMSKLTS